MLQLVHSLPSAGYVVMYADDDICINTGYLHQLLSSPIIGQLWRGQPRIRYQCKSLGKTWLVTIIYRNIYFSANNFPSFCAGLAYFLTKSAIQRLVYEYEEGRDFLWLDDVFITGVLARKAGVKLLDIKVTVLASYAWVKLLDIKVTVQARKAGVKLLDIKVTV